MPKNIPTIEEQLEDIALVEVLISYVQGEDIPRIHQNEEPPLTNEFKDICTTTICKGSVIGHITRSLSRHHYSYTQNT